MTMTDGGASGGSMRHDVRTCMAQPAPRTGSQRASSRSAWLEHAPFAFWLIDELRPRSVVELGTHWGFSFFVFAEAVRRLGIETEISALDTWEGDDQAGFYGEDVYESVRSTAEQEYPGFTRLLRGYFSDSTTRSSADDSVDLLHIDGRHGYEDAREDYEQWRSTVRDGGVVLFHDIAEYGDGFGVWQLWEELAPRHPSFAFSHGHGLGVLGVGDVRSEGLAGALRCRCRRRRATCVRRTSASAGSSHGRRSSRRCRRRSTRCTRVVESLTGRDRSAERA